MILVSSRGSVCGIFVRATTVTLHKAPVDILFGVSAKRLRGDADKGRHARFLILTLPEADPVCDELDVRSTR